MVSESERLIFARELNHLLSELNRCKDAQLRALICEHISLVRLVLIGKSD
ncbi:hypothetical protein Bbad01_39040 [Bacillus badius]|nr:hypothetical protein Bbad01_39040 [Bacillus badius]